MRARNLKPGFFKKPELADAGPHAQLLFAGLWLMADKEGRLKDQPRVIKAEIFPYYDVDVNRELTVIERLGHIRRYVNAGIAVIEVLNFKKHQSPHHTEKASELPPFNGVSDCKDKSHEINGELTVNSRKHNGGNPSDSLIPDSLIPDSLIDDKKASASPPDVQAVFDHWKQSWNHPGAKLDMKRFKRIKARLKDFSVQALCNAIDGFHHSDWHTGSDPRGNGTVYDGIETLLRDSAQVEKGIQLLAHPPKPPPEQKKFLSAVERVKLANEARENATVQQGFGDMGSFGSNVRGEADAKLRRLGSGSVGKGD